MYSEMREYLRIHAKRRIIIYGKKDEAEAYLLDLADRYEFYYMDLEVENAESCGYLSLKQAAQMQIDFVLLVKQMIFRQDLFQKLLSFCKQYRTPMMDAKGRRIDLICESMEGYTYLTREELMGEIRTHACISFDIFDTLLMRKTTFPEDIWVLTEFEACKRGGNITDFAAKRRVAQEELGLTNPNIDEIYKNLSSKYNIPEETADFYKVLEIQMEENQLIVRQDMLEVYRNCVEMGKKIFLVTDMYLPAKIIEGILKKHGIDGYERIYVSCECKQLKIQGLLESYKAQQGENQFLHIGDHPVHDGVCAALAGMDYCLIPNPLTMAKKTLLGDIISQDCSFSERFVTGLLISKIMNSPFQKCWEDGKILIASEYEYGYVFCAALITKFVLWLANNLGGSDCDKVLFAARDGFILQQMYEMIRGAAGGDLPQPLYFYTSRKAAVMTGINNEAYINMIIQISEGMCPETIMKERFGLRQSEIKDYDVNIYEDSIHKYVWEHADSILKRSEEARRNYLRYMGNEELKIGKVYAFIDFVSSGTTQKSLMKMAPFDLTGFYMGWNGAENREEVQVSAMFDGETPYFMRHYKMVETFMTSQEPSLACFDEEGKPVFTDQDRTVKELAYVEAMQAACIDLLRELLTVQKWREINLREEFVDRIFAAKECAEIAMKDSVLSGLTLMDDWKQEKSLVEELDK